MRRFLSFVVADLKATYWKRVFWSFLIALVFEGALRGILYLFSDKIDWGDTVVWTLGLTVYCYWRSFRYHPLPPSTEGKDKEEEDDFEDVELDEEFEEEDQEKVA